MRLLAIALVAFIAIGDAAAQDDGEPTITYRDAVGDFKAVEPLTAQWSTVKRDADISDIAKELGQAGWSEAEVRKLLPPGNKYDLLKTAVAPGQLSYMAVPKSGGASATSIQFGLPAFLGSALGSVIQPASFEEARDDAIAKLRSAVKAICDLPGRPSSVRVAVDVKFLEVEVTWTSTDVCGALEGESSNP